MTIASDCQLTITDFSFDGGAPAVYLWAAPSCSPPDVKKNGYRISDTHIQKEYSNANLALPLSTNVEWSQVGCLIVYCEEFYADLGHAQVDTKADFTFSDGGPSTPQSLSSPSLSSPSPSPSVPPTPTKAPTSTPPKYNALTDLPSCTELIPGYLNFYWAVDQPNNLLYMGFEGRPGQGNYWMGYGYSAPGAPGPTMIGSSTVVAGRIKDECFAFDYHLTDKSQCDFDTADGVCPDFAGKSPLIPKTSAELLACNATGDVMQFLLTRPLNGDVDGVKGSAWPVNGSQYSVFAMGPVSEGSNATVPVVLYHNLQLPGTDAPATVHAAVYDPIKLKLSGTASKNCRMIVPGGVSTGAAGAGAAAPAPATPRTPVAVLNEDNSVDTFTIITGTNKNYPNPPAWGLSLWVNNNESPVLVVQRNATYTFVAEAGETQPIYITSSIVGGGSLVGYTGERVFAGNDTTFGTPQKPKKFSWTPNEKTPDLVYYQCAVHQKLGWEIRVMNSSSSSSSSSGGGGVGTTTPANTTTTVPPSASPQQQQQQQQPQVDTACSINLGKKNGVMQYEACMPIPGVGSGYFIGWNLSSDKTQLSIGVRANKQSSQPSYIAIAIPKFPNTMIGSSAMVIQESTKSETGAIITEFALTGQLPPLVVPAQVLNATDTGASMNANEGELTGKFTIALPPSSTSTGRRLLQQPNLNAPVNGFPLLFASGRLPPNADGTQLQQHDSYGSGSIDLTTALSPEGGNTTSTSTSITARTTNWTARKAHMWLMPISLGLLMPLGVFISRFWPPPTHPTAFQLHRGIQTLAFAAAIGGFAAAFVSVGSWNTVFTAHRDLGMTVMTLLTVQVTALVVRPKPDTKYRASWSFVHHWLGRIVMCLAIANIYYGMIHVGKVPTWAWGLFTGLLAALAVVWVCAEFYSYSTFTAKKNREDVDLEQQKAFIQEQQQEQQRDVSVEKMPSGSSLSATEQ